MRAHLRTAFILALTLGLLAFFFRNADLGQVWVEMRAANLAWIAVAALVNFVTYPLRTLRWQYLLAPVGRVRFWPALSATIIGFAASVILPARAGELLRPYLLARRERLSATSAFATVVLERVLDLVTVLLLLGTFLLTVGPGRGPFDEDRLRAVRGVGLAAALGLLAFIAWQARTAPPPASPPQATQPPAPSVQASPDVTELARQTQRWLAAAAPDTHVIQVASAKEADAAAVLLGSLSAATPQPVRVLHGLSQGRPAWMILAGEFPDRESAMAALRTLPAMPASEPFLRTVGKMRSVVIPTGSQ